MTIFYMPAENCNRLTGARIFKAETNRANEPARYALFQKDICLRIRVALMAVTEWMARLTLDNRHRNNGAQTKLVSPVSKTQKQKALMMDKN